MKLVKSIILIAITVFLLGCKEEKQVQEEIIRPVKFETVGLSLGAKLRVFSGEVKAGTSVDLSFRNSGIITVKNISIGQKVRKGQLLGRLDNIEAEATYQQSLSSLNSAESNLRISEDQLDRIKTLYQTKSVSLSDYETARNNYDNALAQYESAQRNITIAETQLSYGFIYAPADGIIADVEGGVNEAIQAGHLFAVLNTGDQMKVEFDVPSKVVNQLKNGMQTSVSFNAIEGSAAGEIVQIAQLADPQTATYAIEVLLEKASNEIKPGMSAQVQLDLKNSNANDNALIVPIKAVGEDGSGNFVFIIEEESENMGIVQKRKVTIGDLRSDGFVIKDGLNTGDKIVTAGLQTLIEGQKVRF